MSSIEQAIHSFVVETFYVPEEASLAVDTLLLESGIVDSTGVLEILDFLERELGVQVSDDEILPENLGTIARIAALVERKRPERAVVLEPPELA